MHLEFSGDLCKCFGKVRYGRKELRHGLPVEDPASCPQGDAMIPYVAAEEDWVKDDQYYFLDKMAEIC